MILSFLGSNFYSFSESAFKRNKKAYCGSWETGAFDDLKGIECSICFGESWKAQRKTEGSACMATTLCLFLYAYFYLNNVLIQVKK